MENMNFISVKQAESVGSAIFGYRTGQVLSFIAVAAFGALWANGYFTSNAGNLWAGVPAVLGVISFALCTIALRPLHKVQKEYFEQLSKEEKLKVLK